jgi:hypothetical protein
MRIRSFLFSLFLVAVPASFAQSVQIQPRDTKRVEPPGTIHGSEHPELISDLTAYRLFFVSTAMPAAATDAQQRRQTARLASIGLNAVDQLAVSSVLKIFDSENKAFLDKYKNQPSDDKMLPKNYIWNFQLVVNGECFPVGVSVLSDIAHNCQ